MNNVVFGGRCTTLLLLKVVHEWGVARSIVSRQKNVKWDVLLQAVFLYLWDKVVAKRVLENGLCNPGFGVTLLHSRKRALGYVFVCLFVFLKNFIYLFLAVLGLRFCAWAFSSCGERGPLFITVCGPLTVAVSLVAEHKLQMRRLSSCGSRAQLLRGMWDPPRPGLEPVSPALAGRFSTTAPPAKPHPWLCF